MNLKQYLSELEYLVNIDSGQDCPEGIRQIAEFFKEKFDRLGWHTELTDLAPMTGPCLICTNREAERYDLLMIGHIDTVFEKGTAASRPFRIEGDRAYGPGVADMKQGALMMYYVISELPSEVTEKLNIAVVFNPDEEIGSIYSAKVYERYAKRAEHALIYESSGTDGARCIERKGRVTFRAEFLGVDGHCGYKLGSNMRSAISEMARWIIALDGLESRERNTSVNIGVAHGGTVSNVVAKNAYIEADIRFSDPSEAEKIEKLLEKLLTDSAKNGIAAHIRNKNAKPALVPSKKAITFAERVKNISEEIGVPICYRARGGLSDANIIASYGAVCIDGMGPAGDFDHCDKELLLLDTVLPSFKLSSKIIKSMAKSNV